MKVLPLHTQTFFKRVASVAEHYGFCNVDEICSSAVQTNKRNILGIHEHNSPDGHFDHHVLSSVLAHLAGSMELRKRHSLMFYTPSTVSSPGAPNTHVSALTLNTIGVQDPLSEIMVMKTAISILEELGIQKYLLRVNSIGDSDSSARFVREAGTQLRARARDLSPEYATMVRTDVGMALSSLYESRHPITKELPSPLDFLTSPSRKYFKEVLELLEHTDIPFELDDKLYGNHSMYAHTMYEIVEHTGDNAVEILARGGRYDNLTRAYSRSTIPAAGIVVAMHTKDHTGSLGRPPRKKALACLVHIGREARIKSISIIDAFRHEKIPIEQCLQYERFSEQIAYAQTRDTKYVIILGQREVHQNVVIVRNANDRSQKTIPIHMLANFLKTA
ncbi:MAG: ATP phosphoribosyltransferase regulatory subunit [Candidatus Pacebacteria bacterium]|nr:ATP phosphoribosyltransferase regulatory subunit [Candidatus Paceibacterota bacterium]